MLKSVTRLVTGELFLHDGALWFVDKRITDNSGGTVRIKARRLSKVVAGRNIVDTDNWHQTVTFRDLLVTPLTFGDENGL